MSLYPPPPPGWKTSLAETGDDEPAAGLLAQWAEARGYAYEPRPSADWYRSWAPFVFLESPSRILGEVRAHFGDAQIWIVLVESEALGSGGVPRAERAVVSFVLSPRLQYRAAIRARLQKDAVDELKDPPNLRRTPRSLGRWRWREREQMLRRTYGRGVRGVIGDAIFEAHCEVVAPSRAEGLAALPTGLRQWLVATAWRGILELRPGGLVTTAYGPPIFDPASLDATIHHLGHLYHAAIRKVAPAAGPPSST